MSSTHVEFTCVCHRGDQPGGDGRDKFRIKIAGPGGVVYDNQMGAAESDDPTTVISSGHVVIHK